MSGFKEYKEMKTNIITATKAAEMLDCRPLSSDCKKLVAEIKHSLEAALHGRFFKRNG